jgi:hypothetical protein
MAQAAKNPGNQIYHLSHTHLSRVGSCLYNKSRLFLSGKKGHVELLDCFHVIIVSDLIICLAKRLYLCIG